MAGSFEVDNTCSSNVLCNKGRGNEGKVSVKAKSTGLLIAAKTAKIHTFRGSYTSVIPQ